MMAAGRRGASGDPARRHAAAELPAVTATAPARHLAAPVRTVQDHRWRPRPATVIRARTVSAQLNLLHVFVNIQRPVR